MLIWCGLRFHRQCAAVITAASDTSVAPQMNLGAGCSPLNASSVTYRVACHGSEPLASHPLTINGTALVMWPQSGLHFKTSLSHIPFSWHAFQLLFSCFRSDGRKNSWQLYVTMVPGRIGWVQGTSSSLNTHVASTRVDATVAVTIGGHRTDFRHLGHWRAMHRTELSSEPSKQSRKPSHWTLLDTHPP